MAAKAKQRLTLADAWNQVIDLLDRQAPAIGRQLKAARKDYPQLVAAFQLLIGWQGLAARRAAMSWADAALGRVSFTPWPPEPLPRGTIPDSICKVAPTLCACFNDNDIEACIGLADGEDGGPAIPGVDAPFRQLRTCEDVCADYRRALECALRFCQQPSVSRAQLREWAQCQRDIDQYWNELFERGCLPVWSYVQIARELARARLGAEPFGS